MADKKVDAATGEVQLNDVISEQVEMVKDNKWISKIPITPMMDTEKECVEHETILRVHCKPVYNYQSVEFDVEIHDGLQEVDFAYMESLYKGMLEMLVRVSQNAPQKDFKPVQQVEEPATEKQIEVMNTFHIKYPKDVTRKQAQELIKANISAVK